MPITDSDAHAAFLSGETASHAAAPAETQTQPAPSAGAATPAPDTGTAAAAATATGTEAAAPATVAAAENAGRRAADAAAAAGATPGEQRQASQNAITAMLNGQPYEIPGGVQLPYKRGNETVHFPLEQVLRFHMNHRDYAAGKERITAREQQFDRAERELALREARFAEQRRTLEEERTTWLAAATGDDSEQAQRMARHLELMRTDPEYKQTYEDARALRERNAEDAQREELTRYDESRTLAADVSGYIQTVAANFPGVDPAQVQQAYGEALASGTLQWPEHTDPAFDARLAELVPRQVTELFQRAQREQETVAAPFRGELEALRAELAALKGAGPNAAATAHNARTASRLPGRNSTNGQFVAIPAGGAPPAPGGKVAPTPFTSAELEDRRQAWVKGG